MKPTYYGALVRIQYQGNGQDRALIVQRSNPLTGGWLDVTSFHESASYCYSEAKLYATDLAHKLHSESRLSIGRFEIVD